MKLKMIRYKLSSLFFDRNNYRISFENVAWIYLIESCLTYFNVEERFIVLTMEKQANITCFLLVDAAWSDGKLFPDQAGRNSEDVTRCYSDVRQGVNHNINDITVKLLIDPIIPQLLHPVTSQERAVEFLI